MREPYQVQESTLTSPFNPSPSVPVQGTAPSALNHGAAVGHGAAVALNRSEFTTVEISAHIEVKMRNYC